MLTRDRRDKRDPAALGKKLFKEAKTVRKTYGKDIKLSEIYDVHVRYLDVPEYKGFLMGHYTAAAYKKELAERTSEGDIYAKSTLEGIELGIKPLEDPSGN